MTEYQDGTGIYVADSRAEETAKRYFKPFLKYFSNTHNGIELASGKGVFLSMVEQSGGHMTGIELDPQLCQISRDKQLTVIEDNMFNYMDVTAENTHDGCMASHIVEHFQPHEVRKICEEVFKILSPGAYFVILTPNIANLRRASGDFWRDPTHVRPYPISAMSNILRMTGWDIAESGELSDRRPSLARKIKYAIRNALIGRFWGGDDIYVIAQKPEK